MKVKHYKNGSAVIFEPPSGPRGMFCVTVRGPGGGVIDRVRCDTRRAAQEYFRAFCCIAKNA